MRIDTKSNKVRRELWVGLGVATILSAGVLALNAKYANQPVDFVVESGMVMDENKAATTTTPTTTAKPASPKPAVPRETHVYAVLSGIDGTSRFANVLSQTGVSSVLAGGGPYSVFVPVNSAMSYANTASMSAAEKKRFAEYHVIKDRAVDISALRAGNVYAASGDQLNFVVVGDQKLERVNSSRIINEYKASNGVIYIIDAPLFPPEKQRF